MPDTMNVDRLPLHLDPGDLADDRAVGGAEGGAAALFGEGVWKCVGP